MTKKNIKIRSDEASEPKAVEGLDEKTPDKAQKKAREKKSSLKERLEAAEAKAEENYERLLRMSAEFENYKKRSEREMDGFRKFANESLIKEILPIIDNLERALATQCDKNDDAFRSFREGVEMTLKGLLDSLEKFGAVPLEALGEPFDPNFHQAVSQEESDQHPDNTVSQELQKGYMLGDRLLRPSMVVVSKKPAANEETEGAGAQDKSEKKIAVH